MNALKLYTYTEAQNIINADEALQKAFNELKPYYERCELDHGFTYGNFFNCDNFADNQIVIQWCDDNDNNHEVVVDSLEVLVVVIRDIEVACGNVCGWFPN